LSQGEVSRDGDGAGAGRSARMGQGAEGPEDHKHIEIRIFLIFTFFPALFLYFSKFWHFWDLRVIPDAIPEILWFL
jgi:hypothetical protein